MTKQVIRLKKNEAKPVVELVNLVKDFGQKNILNDLNMAIKKGEFVTLLGASGSGKTTALRLIAGLEWPTRGEIKFNGVDVKDLPAYKRPTNTIFQDYALFPHLTVAGNIKYGLKLVRVAKDNVAPAITKKLQEQQHKWNHLAQVKMKDLDQTLLSYEKSLKQIPVKSRIYKKTQKAIDKADFLYSYWENYVLQKTEKFERKYTTRKLSKQEVHKKLQWAITLIGLSGNEKKAIHELSGGMKQRVALARALVTEPKILLLDEPLSALDLKVRQKMQRELKSIQKKLGLTFIFVTHDQEEAMTISDRIAVMRDGKIEQFDKPQIIYEYPNNSWVANFIGVSNIFPATVVKQNQINAFKQVLPGDTYDFKPKTKVKVMLRPEDISISLANGFLSGTIVNCIFQGTFWEYTIKTSDANWKVRTTKTFALNTKVKIKWTASDVHTMRK